ncbi:DMP19 family protein [Aeoliella sp. ICT_H6.2]|uniref:DMP19 family protein n=1 Tax=Aeoliella straminimaris TaxID=2954799 RepID=A0A9X2F9Y6_9BACT|nr:DUF4375 domain-containing protein [Aeoliella straminimaris]MCO6042439.1 DMP19 family protein [Aeoliella straminimaris]
MHRIILYAATLVPVVGCSSKSSDTTSEATEDSAMVNIDLADDTFKRILKKHGEDVDPSKIPKPQQTVMLVYHSYGILGNGGFQYLFEGDFPGDPEFLLTRQAYKTIGASDASAAFEKAFAVFPNSTPPADIDRRLEMWQSKYNLLDSMKDKSSPDSMYFSAMDGVMEKLNGYIKANEAEFASLPK